MRGESGTEAACCLVRVHANEDSGAEANYNTADRKVWGLRMHPLDLLNKPRWYGRLPLKAAILGVTVLLVCFPYPRRLLTNLERWKDPNRLVEPHHPRLRPWLEELRGEVGFELPTREALDRVQSFVYRKVSYEWDWNTWGVADYLPTVSEVLDQRKEDCDGRAVIAASLLRNLGFDARLVNDLTHVWVRTELGDTMSPGEAPVAVATDEGLSVRRPPLMAMVRAIGVGIAVFPMVRELVIAVVLWVLLIRRETGLLWAALTLLLLVGGLDVVRAGGARPHGPNGWVQVAGALVVITAVVLVFVRNRVAAPGSRAQDQRA